MSKDDSPEFLPPHKFTDSLDRQITQNAELFLEWSGERLRQIRELRHLSIEEISQQTKISKTYLKAIECEDFKKLPAPVYVRGFVNQLAKSLKLPPDQVSKTYMKRFFLLSPSP
jgi:flagellar biosynthesis protein FlhG